MGSRLILFDLDGTLVDTAGAGKKAIERAFLELYGIDAAAEKSSAVRFAGMTDSSIFRELAKACGITPLRFAALRAELYSRYLQALREEMARHEPKRQSMPGVRRLLEALVERPDVSLGLLTGNLEAGARIKLEPFGMNHFFRGGGFGSDHDDRKEVARLAWLRLRNLTTIPFPASRVVVVGDTGQDVACAQANGFRAIAVAAGWATREELESSNPDALLEDLSDLDQTVRAFGLNQVRD